MKILALEPYFGGSHKAFLEGWKERSCHDWQLFTLPPSKWKWRMRHSAITFSDWVREAITRGGTWDLLFCSDMLGLAEFLGIVGAPVSALPSVVYFHENQLTYPVEHEKDYDYHFAFSNMTSALAARQVWFNSAYHRDSFLTALPRFLRRMPDYVPLDAVERIASRAVVRYPGLSALPSRGERRPGPIRILWAARWEYDKCPQALFRALESIESADVDFELSVLGGYEGPQSPPVFAEARSRFGDRIIHWGYQSSREKYEVVLSQADVVVSTAEHEFFGIAVLEAVAAGAYPLVPNRLAYPEVLGDAALSDEEDFLYEGGAEELALRLVDLARRVAEGRLWSGDPLRGVKAAQKFAWGNVVPAWDREIEALAKPEL